MEKLKFLVEFLVILDRCLVWGFVLFCFHLNSVLDL